MVPVLPTHIGNRISNDSKKVSNLALLLSNNVLIKVTLSCQRHCRGTETIFLPINQPSFVVGG